MIKRVRRQFIAITMTMLTTVLLVPLVAMNIIVDMISYNQTKNILEQIAISEAVFWEKEEIFDNPQPHQNESFAVPPEEMETELTSTTVSTTMTTVVVSITSTSAVSDDRQEQPDFPSAIMSEESQQSPPSQQQTQPARQTTPVEQTKSAAVTQTPIPEKTPSERVTAPVGGTAAAGEIQTVPPQKVTAPQTQPPQQSDPDPFLDPNPYPDPEPDPMPDNSGREDRWEWDWSPDPNWEWIQEQEPLAFRQTAVIDTLSMTAHTEPKQNYVTTETTSTAVTSETSKTTPPSRPKKEIVPVEPKETITIDNFICIVDKEGHLINLDGTEDYTEDEAQQLVDEVFAIGDTDGVYGNLQFYRKDMKSDTILVFSDRSEEQLLLRNILWISIFVFFFMEGIVLLLTMILTKRAMQPMHQTFERQRQFISDAGHELKTPLTIISANVEILQDEIGDNKWLSYIQSQAERMRVLIADMMNLTKLDMGETRRDFQQFSLSAAVSSAALPFESQVFEQNKKLELEIQENITYTGNLNQIKQLVGIFIDNAIKYSDEQGEIRVTLSQVRDKRTLKFYNTGKGVTPEEKEKIFERFYRSDSSRTRTTGGYGLGLSIAKSIADSHKMKIQVESEYGKWVCFILTF